MTVTKTAPLKLVDFYKNSEIYIVKEWLYGKHTMGN